MGNIANYLENKLLDHTLKVAEYVPPAGIFASFHTADPTDAGTGAEVANANGYLRQQVDDWDAVPLGTRKSQNTNKITYPQATGAGWGIATHWALWDSGTYGEGNCLAHGSFTIPKTIVAGNIPYINPGEIEISVISGAVSNYLAKKWLEHFLKIAVFTVPTNLEVAFSTANPGNDGSGLAEPSGNNYARTVANDWDAAVDGVTQNTNPITTNVATGSWGNITHSAIFDDEATPNMLLYGTIVPNQPVDADDNLEYDTGDFIVTLD